MEHKNIKLILFNYCNTANFLLELCGIPLRGIHIFTETAGPPGRRKMFLKCPLHSDF